MQGNTATRYGKVSNKEGHMLIDVMVISDNTKRKSEGYRRPSKYQKVDGWRRDRYATNRGHR